MNFINLKNEELNDINGGAIQIIDTLVKIGGILYFLDVCADILHSAGEGYKAGSKNDGI